MGICIVAMGYLAFILADAAAIRRAPRPWSRWYGVPGYGIWIWIKTNGETVHRAAQLLAITPLGCFSLLYLPAGIAGLAVQIAAIVYCLKERRG